MRAQADWIQVICVKVRLQHQVATYSLRLLPHILLRAAAPTWESAAASTDAEVGYGPTLTADVLTSCLQPVPAHKVGISTGQRLKPVQQVGRHNRLQVDNCMPYYSDALPLLGSQCC